MSENHHLPEDMKQQVEELNLCALTLAQALLRTDRLTALHRLGVDEAAAQIIEKLSPAQMQKLSKVPRLLFPVRFDQKMVWEALGIETVLGGGQPHTGAHAFIAGMGRERDKEKKRKGL